MKRNNSSSLNATFTNEKYQCLYCEDPKWVTDYSDRLKAHYTRSHMDKIKNDPKKFKDENNNANGIQFPTLLNQNNLDCYFPAKFLFKSKSLDDIKGLNLNSNEKVDTSERTNDVETQTDFFQIPKSPSLIHNPDLFPLKLDKSTSYSPIKDILSSKSEFTLIPQSSSKSSTSGKTKSISPLTVVPKYLSDLAILPESTIKSSTSGKQNISNSMTIYRNIKKSISIETNISSRVFTNVEKEISLNKSVSKKEMYSEFFKSKAVKKKPPQFEEFRNSKFY